MQVSDEEFEQYMTEAIDSVPEPFGSRLENIAFIIEDYPSEQQRQQQRLGPHQTLLGLYEGVPLPMRGGRTKLLPDKITIFKYPLLSASRDKQHLRDNIGHTVWHETAHYFGLDHKKIDELDAKRNNN
jgi:predicted Zn-dependent protease with MMP-like domain